MIKNAEFSLAWIIISRGKLPEDREFFKTCLEKEKELGIIGPCSSLLSVG